MVPITVALQFLAPYINCCVPWWTGATVMTSSSSAMALASPMRRVKPNPPPERTPAVCVQPERMTYRLLPMVLIVCATAYCAPWPMAIISTTEPTPMTMPSMVSAVRSLLQPMACQASPNIGFSMIASRFRASAHR